MNDHTASNIEHLLRIHLPALSRIADALEAIAKKSDSDFVPLVLDQQQYR